jgi:hypothetical protein
VFGGLFCLVMHALHVGLPTANDHGDFTGRFSDGGTNNTGSIGIIN